MLELRAVDKRFPGVHALKGVSLTVGRGEIVGLVGENGAGKSTLMKLIYGAHAPDAGEILIDGAPARFRGPADALARGVAMVFQEQSLIPNLSVMENIFLGAEGPFLRAGVLDRRAMAAAARAQLARVRLDVDPRAVTAGLSFAQRQLVELARVLAVGDRVAGDLVVLLDEPTSVLAQAEIDLLFDLVRGLRARASFIFVSHRLDEVLALSDRVYTMRDGAVVDMRPAAGADPDAIQHMMVGRALAGAAAAARAPYDAGRPLLAFDGAAVAGRFAPLSLTLRRGEVLALVGVEGSGREAILRAAAGMTPLSAGAMRLDCRPYAPAGPRDAVRRGVGHVPRERRVEGVVGGMTVAENISLPRLGAVSRLGVLRVGAERALARDWIARLGIRTPSERTDCRRLSGGNQQKVALARWRSAGMRLMLLDHPTRGLDVGAKADVYAMIRDMAAEGVGVIVAPDTLEEAIGMAHTILAVKDGAVTGRFDLTAGPAPTAYDLVKLMV